MAGLVAEPLGPAGEVGQAQPSIQEQALRYLMSLGQPVVPPQDPQSQLSPQLPPEVQPGPPPLQPPAPMPEIPVARGQGLVPPTPDYSGAEASLQQDQQQSLGASTAQANLLVDAGRKEAAAEAEAGLKQERVLAEKQDTLRKIYQARDAAVDRKRAEADQLFNQAARTKIRPNALWEDASAPAKISTAIGVALGGLLAPYGQRNPALDIFQKRIEQNIDAQKSNLDNLYRAGSATLNMLGELRQKFGDQEAAENTMRAIQLDQIGAELTVQLAGAKDVKAQARGQELGAAIAERSALYKEAAMTRLGQRTSQEWENELGAFTAKTGRMSVHATIQNNKANQFLAGAELAQRQAELEAHARAEQAKAEADLGKGAVWMEGVNSGGAGFRGDGGDALALSSFPTPADAEKYQGKMSGHQHALDILATINEIGTDENRWPDAEKAIGKAGLAELTQRVAQARERGAPSDKDTERVVNSIGGTDDPQKAWTAMSGEDRKKVFDYVERSIREEATVEVKSRTMGKGSYEYKGRSRYVEPPPAKQVPFTPSLEAAKSAAKADGTDDVAIVDTLRKSPFAKDEGSAQRAIRASEALLAKQVKLAGDSSKTEAERVEARRQVAELDSMVKAMKSKAADALTEYESSQDQASRVNRTLPKRVAPSLGRGQL